MWEKLNPFIVIRYYAWTDVESAAQLCNPVRKEDRETLAANIKVQYVHLHPTSDIIVRDDNFINENGDLSLSLVGLT